MSWYRNAVFMAKGLQEYTRSGYARAAESFNAGDLQVDCTGRHFMITGANSGVGQSLCEAIASRGGTVHMVCRNGEAANAVAEEIRQKFSSSSTPSAGSLHVHVVDLSRPRQVYRFASNFAAASNACLHVLINNAGCMVHAGQEVTADGLDTNTATNTLAVHVLTETLMPLLKAAGDGRVVVVSSAGMLTQKLCANQVAAVDEASGSGDAAKAGAVYDGTFVYAQNKRQQVVMVEEYARRYPQVKFFSMHPGWADTPAVRTAMPQFYERMKSRLRTAAQGADTALWLAIADAGYQQTSGDFFQDRKSVSKHLPLAWTRNTAEEQQQLMNKLDELLRTFAAPE